MPRRLFLTRIQHYLLSSAVLLIVLLGFSCFVEQHITINANGSGSLSMVIDLDPAFIQYLVDVGEASGEFESAQDAAIFEKTEIQKIINESMGNFLQKMKDKIFQIMPFQDLVKNVYMPVYKKYFTLLIHFNQGF